MNNEKVIKGIDISEHNGTIDFAKVKKEVDFIMIRATYGKYNKDKNFETYVKGCIDNNIPFGVYHYSYALDEEDAKEEVKNILRVISPYKDKISYPVAIDMEDADGYKKENGFPTNEMLNTIVKTEHSLISMAGYFVICYASKSWYDTILNNIPEIPKWVAWWNVNEKKIDKSLYKMWQHTSKGRISGINTQVDLNISFVEFDKLTCYLNNVKMIQDIKLKTGLEDISMQFLSCYKYGQDLIKKIFNRLQIIKDYDKKLDGHKFTNEEIVQREYMLEGKTIEFMKNYIYYEELFKKLVEGLNSKN